MVQELAQNYNPGTDYAKIWITYVGCLAGTVVGASKTWALASPITRAVTELINQQAAINLLVSNNIGPRQAFHFTAAEVEAAASQIGRWSKIK